MVSLKILPKIVRGGVLQRLPCFSRMKSSALLPLDFVPRLLRHRFGKFVQLQRRYHRNLIYIHLPCEALINPRLASTIWLQKSYPFGRRKR